MTHSLSLDLSNPEAPSSPPWDEGGGWKTQEDLGAFLCWRPPPKDGAEHLCIHSTNTEHLWQPRCCFMYRHPCPGGAPQLRFYHPLKEHRTACLAMHVAVCSSPAGQSQPRAHCTFSPSVPRERAGDPSLAPPCSSSQLISDPQRGPSPSCPGNFEPLCLLSGGVPLPLVTELTLLHPSALWTEAPSSGEPGRAQAR